MCYRLNHLYTAQVVLDMDEICCGIHKELDVYKYIMNKHFSENFSKSRSNVHDK